MLSKILHPYYYQLLHYFIGKDNNAIGKGNTQPRVFVLMSADYGNIGDIAITIAQTRLLRQLFPSYEIVNLPASSIYKDLKSLVRNISKDDIITFVGGGNSGDLYYPYEIYRQLVVCLVRHNPIICFPQSVKYKDDGNARKARNVYKGRKNLIYLARDDESRDFFLNYYKVRSEVLPDIVMTMDKYSNGKRSGALMCFRNDKESMLSDDEKSMIFKNLGTIYRQIDNIDTYIPNQTFGLNKIEGVFSDFIKKVSSAAILITDRLHGMIMGFITGTPTIVFPNNNNKIKGCYKWIKDCRYVQYVEKIEHLGQALQRLEEVTDRRSEFNLAHQRIITEYDKLNQIIGNEIKHNNSGI